LNDKTKDFVVLPDKILCYYLAGLEKGYKTKQGVIQGQNGKDLK
jgi:hypothetical protein